MWPLLYIFLFMFSMFGMASNMNEFRFDFIFRIHLATILQGYFMIGGYIYYIVKTNIVPKNKKTLWVVIIFLGNMIAMPVFWYLYLWKPLKNQTPEDIFPNIFAWILGSSALLIIAAIFIKSPFPEMGGNDIYNLAIRDDGIKIQEILQENPALANFIRKSDNWTPLHGAACNGNINTVKVLLNSNADVNIANINNETPLHCAVQDNHLEIVRLLLAAGANPNIIGCKNKTPLDWAVWNDHKEMVILLKQYGAKLSTEK